MLAACAGLSATGFDMAGRRLRIEGCRVARTCVTRSNIAGTVTRAARQLAPACSQALEAFWLRRRCAIARAAIAVPSKASVPGSGTVPGGGGSAVIMSW